MKVSFTQAHKQYITSLCLELVNFYQLTQHRIFKPGNNILKVLLSYTLIILGKSFKKLFFNNLNLQRSISIFNAAIFKF